MKNWWYYYKWYVVCGAIILLILIDLTGNAFGWFKKSPDIQIAYIGETKLSDDTVTVLKNTFASFADDYNNDGEILVQINQFASGNSEDTSVDAMSYRQASMIALMGDINNCDSYFFLMENPENVQMEFQVLAMPDGSCPDDTDFSTEGKVFQWKDCKLLSETKYRSSKKPLKDLYLGRRCFYNSKHSDYKDKCSQLWNTLQGELY